MRHVAAVAAVLVLAACGSSGHPAATVTRTVTAVPSSLSPAAASASPSPPPRSPSPGPTSPSPSPSGRAAGPCVLIAFSGNCGPYFYPANTASSGYNTYVGPDFFSPVGGETTKLTVHGPGNWDDLVNAAAGNASVTGYPSNSQGASGDGTEQPISAYTKITSAFAEDMNANPGTDAEAAYDVWTGTANTASHETMIQFDFTPLRPKCTGSQIGATVAFTEPVSGTVQDWDFCQFGNERIWQLHSGSEQSGSVNILAMLSWEQDHGNLPMTDRLGLVGFGTEICSTGGQPEDFQVTRYSLTALPKS